MLTPPPFPAILLPSPRLLPTSALRTGRSVPPTSLSVHPPHLHLFEAPSLTLPPSPASHPVPPADVDTWAVSPRGAGWLFGAKVTQEFSHLNGLSLIARAHQLVQEGYKHMFDERLVTVWSAPK